jgi:hypothetical protein
MDKTKKILLVVFATMLVINLQFNTPLTKGMNNGFSLSQLVENVFVQESYAEDGGDYGYIMPCPTNPIWDICENVYNYYNCVTTDPGWGCK